MRHIAAAFLWLVALFAFTLWAEVMLRGGEDLAKPITESGAWLALWLAFVCLLFASGACGEGGSHD